MSPAPVPHDLELLARALRLSRHDLAIASDARAADDWKVAVLKQLQVDAYDDRPTIERILDQIKNRNEDVVQQIRFLAEHTFTLRHGLPVLRSGFNPRRLLRTFDPDVAVCFHPHFRVQMDDAFDWPAVPLMLGSEICHLSDIETVDTHIHLSGALPPLYYWIPLMGGDLRVGGLNRTSADRAEFGAHGSWRDAIAAAACRRLRLAARLTLLAPELGLDDPFPFIGRSRWPAAEVMSFGQDGGTDSVVVVDQAALEKLFFRDVVFELGRDARAREGFKRYHPTTDPLRSPGFHHRPHYAEGERRLLVAFAGAYNRLQARGDAAKPLLAELNHELAAYLNLRHLFHRRLIHDHGSVGLFRFVETFSQRGAFAGNHHHNQKRRNRRNRRKLRDFEAAKVLTALNDHLHRPFEPKNSTSIHPHRVELRVSLDPGRLALAQLRGWVKGILTFLEQQRSPKKAMDRRKDADALPSKTQVGLIYHLIKGQHAAEPDEFALYQVERLIHFMESYPGLRRFIIGLDAAGLERNHPPRDFVSAFHRLQHYENEIRLKPEEPSICLGYTYHVGEDCNDMLTGLRHMDEVIQLILPYNGGRIGHGLVLIQSPKAFYKRWGNNVPLQLGPHLLDLVWAKETMIDLKRPEIAAMLEKRLGRLLGRTPDQLPACYREMRLDLEAAQLRLESLDRTFSRFWGGPIDDQVARDRYRFRESYLLDMLGVPREDRHREVILKVDKPWRGMIKMLQQTLRGKLARRRICIEANPSSNLLIGGWKDYHNIPYHKFINDHLMMSLNTDDPGLFMTSLPGEFAAMYYALEHEGMAHRDIIEWLRARRFDATQSTFLRSTPPKLILGSDFVARNMDATFSAGGSFPS